MSFGSYEVLLCIARGGMATVWAARQHGARGFNRLVALKTVLPELCEPEFESMFLDEARVAARIHHPNVCEIFELVEHQGMLALSMEWVDGETLNTIINSRESEPLDARVAAHIVAQAAGGLHAAHELKDENGLPMQLVHRDVSPQNILISRAGHVKVTDFGVAKALGDSREETEIGRVKGKLSYMSPEQAESKPLDRRSDIFALGVVLYLATVGLHPFRRASENRDDQYMRLLVGDFRRPSSIIAGYPSELEAIILRALSREPADRFATAEEMRLRLQEWLLRSGPLLTEQHIARAVSERVGKTIEDRAERIQRCIRASRRSDKFDVIATGSELTFLPTTSGMGGSMFTRSGMRPFGLPRVLGVAAALLLLAAVGTLSLAGGDAKPEAGHSAAAASSAPPAASPVPAAPAAAPSEPARGARGALEPDEAARPPAAAERRGPLSLPEAMARALAERKENARRDASGSKARPSGSNVNGPSASPDRATRPSSSPAARSGSRRDSLPAKIGPLESDL
jgi:eukaryotic-like serine/threonine-protein kinase